MVLFLFHEHGRFAELGQLFPNGAYTANVILSEEVGGREAWRRRNAVILNAPWLCSAPVLTGSDAAMVNNLLNIWNSPPDQDRGEAEILVLCLRHNWARHHRRRPQRAPRAVNPPAIRIGHRRLVFARSPEGRARGQQRGPRSGLASLHPGFNLI